MRIAIALFAVICLQYCFAKPPNLPMRFGYPGHSTSNGSVNLLHTNLMNEGITQFYLVYQRWPESWREVRDSGLVQVPLFAPCGQEVDPDDREVDFVGDNVYLPPRSKTGTPYCKTYYLSKGQKVTPYVPRETYAATIQRSGKWSEMADDTKRLTQFAMCNELRIGAIFFAGKFERSPANLQEVLSSGLCALDQLSINPLTGDVIHGDGRPNDFLFYPDPDSTFVDVLPVDEHGRIPWDFSEMPTESHLKALFQRKPANLSGCWP